MTSKPELYEQLEDLGFDCGRNPRYTIGMLTQIRDNLQERVDLLVDQATELTYKNRSLRKLESMEYKYELAEDLIQEKNNVIAKLNRQCYAMRDLCKETSEVLKKKNQELKELKERHDNAKNKDYETHIQQLNDELREIRREFKSFRKKSKKLEKKRIPQIVYKSEAPDYDPPVYDSHS